MTLGNHDDFVGEAGGQFDALRDDRDDPALAGFDFLHRRNDLVQNFATRGKKDTRAVRADQGDGAVLHLGGRIALRVDIGNFLQLERPFQRDGKQRQAAEEKHIGVTGVPPGNRLDMRGLFQGPPHQVGRALQRPHIIDPVGETQVPHPADVQGEHRPDEQLRGEGLRGRDPDFGTDVLVNAAVRFPGDRGAHDIRHREDFVPLALRFAEGGEGVDRLARLTHHEEERVPKERRIAVTELGGVVALDRDAGKPLDHVLGHHAGMQRRAAGAEREALDPPKLSRRNIQSAEIGRAAILGKTAAHGVFERDRLLEDFLLHEMGVGAHFGVGHRPGHLVDKRRHRLLIEGGDPELLRGEVDDFAVFQVNDRLGAGDNRRDIAGDDVLAVAQAEDERRTFPGGHHFAGEIDAHGHDAVGAFGMEEGLAHGGEAAVLLGGVRFLRVVVGDEVAKDLRVRLGLEGIALGQEKLLHRAVVLDDPVVDEDDLAVAAEMGVGIRIGHPAMGRPPRMAHAEGSVQGRLRHFLLQVGDAADFFDDAEGPVLQDRDAGRIVTAVLEPLESLQDEGRRFLFTHVADDAAHN